MLAIRSLVFNAVFYLNLIVQMILWAPVFFLMQRKKAWFVPKFWARSSLWLHDKLAGTKNEITGLENLPQGSFILAPKHQSFWDAIAFFPHLRDPLYILQRKLTWIPFFGWYILKMRLIPVDRGDLLAQIHQAGRVAQQSLHDGAFQVTAYVPPKVAGRIRKALTQKDVRH
jgi:1-acyl-sn-glycerol-3-phosphate acyltransferase